MSDTVLLIILLVPALVIAIVLHEVAHGWMALMLGDPTAKERRRLTLNPVRHVDPVGTLLVPGALALFGGPIFGWAKPVPVLKNRLNNPRFGMMAVAAAGPGTNLILAAIGAALLGLTAPEGIRLALTDTGLPVMVGGDGVLTVAGTGFFFFVMINVFLALFNLLPIPPFDGSHIVEGLLPRSWARAYDRLRPVGMVLLLALIAITWLAPGLGLLDRVIGPPVYWLLDRYMAIADMFMGM